MTCEFDISLNSDRRLSLAERIDEVITRIIETNPDHYNKGILAPVIAFCEKIINNPQKPQPEGIQDSLQRIDQALEESAHPAIHFLPALKDLLKEYEGTLPSTRLTMISSENTIPTLATIVLDRANDNQATSGKG